MSSKPECAAGRTAFFGGKWQQQCPEPARHYIGNPGGEPIALCDEHFNEVAAAGLVAEQNIGREAFDAREAARKSEGSRFRLWRRS